MAETAKINGTELAYLEHGQGQPIVFVHGGVGDYREWELQVPSAICSEWRIPNGVPERAARQGGAGIPDRRDRDVRAAWLIGTFGVLPGCEQVRLPAGADVIGRVATAS